MCFDLLLSLYAIVVRPPCIYMSRVWSGESQFAHTRAQSNSSERSSHFGTLVLMFFFFFSVWCVGCARLALLSALFVCDFFLYFGTCSVTVLISHFSITFVFAFLDIFVVVAAAPWTLIACVLFIFIFIQFIVVVVVAVLLFCFCCCCRCVCCYGCCYCCCCFFTVLHSWSSPCNFIVLGPFRSVFPIHDKQVHTFILCEQVYLKLEYTQRSRHNIKYVMKGLPFLYYLLWYGWTFVSMVLRKKSKVRI